MTEKEKDTAIDPELQEEVAEQEEELTSKTEQSEEEAKTEEPEQSEATETPKEEEDAPSLEEELAQLQDSYLRVRAEYANYRNRTNKEKADLLKYGGEKVVLAFLEIMDDFDLALKNLEVAESQEGIVEGVQLIYNKFLNTLKSQKVEEIEVIGEDFNADIHDAVALVPTDDKKMKGKVIDCVQKGYRLNDKVIRHPKVVVGQ